MKCQRLIDDARQELNDPREARWSNDDLLAYLNDALLALIQVRPDASMTTASLLLVQGTEQSLPAGALRLVKVSRNLGADGTTPGRAVQVGDRQAIDAIDPNWHQTSGATVLEYFYDPIVPRRFAVYPAVPASPKVYVEATYSALPAVVDEPEAADLPVDDSYAPALREWMLYRAWGGDDESSPNYAQARDRRGSFYEALGMKAQSDSAASARVNDNG